MYREENCECGGFHSERHGNRPYWEDFGRDECRHYSMFGEWNDHCPCRCRCPQCDYCCGWRPHHHGGVEFHRHFISHEEMISNLEEYLKQLQAEAKGVEEYIARLKEKGESK